MIITVTHVGNTLDPLSTPARVSPRPDRSDRRPTDRDR
jgi:hypothetical protein